MLYEKPTASNFGMVLAIVLPEKRLRSVETLLDKFAQINWRTSDSIFLIVVADQYINSGRHIIAAARKQCKNFGLVPSGDNVRYIILEDLSALKTSDMEWIKHSDVSYIYSYKRLADDLFQRKLKEWSLDWKSCALVEIKKWHHDEIDNKNIEIWLNQFDRFGKGELRWIGELLLKHFRVWNSQEIQDSFATHFDFSPFSGQSCIMRYENGKSGDSLSVILRKKFARLLSGSKVLEYREFLESGQGLACDLFEDGVFTGVEIGDIFKSLLGMDGYTKCLPLTDHASLTSKLTTLHFSLGTDVGMSAVSKTIESLGIPVQLRCSNVISVLTESGAVSLADGTLYEEDEHGKRVFVDVDAHIIPQAFVHESWGSRRGQAIDFSKKIGLQLFRSYQENKGKFWSDKRLKECSLGAGNMALLFAFAHSLPKSTLPFFWCHGKTLDQNGKPFSWLPLFPSAHLN
jgi:hypothetical protein